MKDIRAKLAEQNGMFNKSLYSDNIDVYNLIIIISRIRERCLDKENNDVFIDLVIAAEAYYKNIDKTKKSFKEFGVIFINTLRFLLTHITKRSPKQVSGSLTIYTIGRSPKQVERIFYEYFRTPA